MGGKAKRNIPEDIKREVRKRCKFGCVLCGAPVFQYDHIDEWAKVREHKIDNIALLCPNHHHAKTSNKIHAERVRRALQKPFNCGRNFTSAHDIQGAPTIKVSLGTCQVNVDLEDYSVTTTLFQVCGVPFLSLHFEDGFATISATITDQIGKVLLKIDHGELIVSTQVWDYKYEGTHLTIRGSRRAVLLDLDLTNEHFDLRKGTFFDTFMDGINVDGSKVGFSYGGQINSGLENLIFNIKCFQGFLKIDNPAHHEAEYVSALPGLPRKPFR